MLSAARASAAVLAGVGCLVVACGGGDEASKPADVILTDASAAFSAVHSYRFSGSAGTSSFDLRIAGVRKLKGSLTAAGTSAEIVVVNGRIYLRGREYISKTISQVLANRAGDHFVRFPASADLSLFDQISDTALASKCLLQQLGTLTKGKTVTVNGHSAIEIKSAGDKPGTIPMIIDVQTSGPAYPLRLTQTGPQKAGGTPPDPRCGRSTMTGHIDLSDFGAAVDVSPPADAIDANG